MFTVRKGRQFLTRSELFLLGLEQAAAQVTSLAIFQSGIIICSSHIILLF